MVLLRQWQKNAQRQRLFDKHHNLLDASWKQIGEEYEQTSTPPVKDPFDHMIRQMVAREEGYAYVFVSNENPTQVDIHFDELKVTHTKTRVIQYNEYYPFGLQTERSWTRDNNKNAYLYNAATELNNTSGWYETHFRGYDAALGRFLQVDPMATKYAGLTAYNYGFNNPVYWNDPWGLDPSITWEQLYAIINHVWNNGGGTWSREAYLQAEGSDNGGACPGCTVFGNNATYEYVGGSSGGTLYVTTSSAQISADGNEMRGFATVNIININLYTKTADFAGWDIGEGEVNGNEGLGWTDFAGMGFDAADDVMGGVASNFARIQLASNEARLGLSFSSEVLKVNRVANGMKWGARGLGVINAFSIESKYRNREISNGQRWAEQGTNAFSTFGGPHGAAWGFGWEIGRGITTIPAYQSWKHETWLPWRKENLGY